MQEGQPHRIRPYRCRPLSSSAPAYTTSPTPVLVGLDRYRGRDSRVEAGRGHCRVLGRKSWKQAGKGEDEWVGWEIKAIVWWKVISA